MQIPKIPNLHDRTVTKAHDNRVRLVRELATQERAVAVAEAEHQAALVSDRDALAKAYREGTSEPEPIAAKAHTAVVEEQRRHEALKQATEEAGQAVADVIESRRGALEQAAAKRLATARERFLAIIDQLEMAHADVAAEEATTAWLARFPDNRGGAGRARRVTALPPARNGEPLELADVTTALRKLGSQPEPRTPENALPTFERGAVVTT
jgi:hypothetical protein